MATIKIDGTQLVVTLERSEKLWGLLSDLRVPFDSVTSADISAAPSTAISPSAFGVRRASATR